MCNVINWKNEWEGAKYSTKKIVFYKIKKITSVIGETILLYSNWIVVILKIDANSLIADDLFTGSF